MNLRKVFYRLSAAKALTGAGIVLIAGAGLGFWFGTIHAQSITKQMMASIHPVRENNFNYQFIYPLLGYDFALARPFFEDRPLETKMNEVIQREYRDKNADSISVYVRSFHDLGWAGINQQTQYQPGSMLKVLIMIGFFREAQLDPTVLRRSLLYDKTANQTVANIPFALPTNLKIGQRYGVEQLIGNMIQNSDTGAEILLLNNMDHKILNDAYTDLNLSNPDSVPENYTISAEQYTGFLRILYNSTYLAEQYSEKALSLMSRTTYRDGIVSGVPVGVTVSHKYGERVQAAPNGQLTVELHDCGVVYAKSAYAICVMTKGSDEKKLAAAISNISAIVYEDISSH